MSSDSLVVSSGDRLYQPLGGIKRNRQPGCKSGSYFISFSFD